MTKKPTVDDFKIIFFYIGKVQFAVGITMVIPLITAILSKEWNVTFDFLIGIFSMLLFWIITDLSFRTDKDMKWLHGLVTVSFSWVVATILGAIPHFLSGHFGSYLDACFDLMSGYTTTGLILIKDLDHVSNGLNMWRLLLTYEGGQGIIVFALVFLFRSSPGAYRIYAGEGKDERLLPNVIKTAQFIWLISIAYLIIGTLILTMYGIFIGFSPIRSFLHGLWMFMSAWSTGGFAPQSQNMLYYHSFGYEIITMIIFIIGSLNFAFHYTVWFKDRKEVIKNIETISFMITVFITSSLLLSVLIRNNVYEGFFITFKKGFYQLVSGHTTTGLMTIYSRTFIKEWGAFAMAAVTIAMAIGASACSTAGGFKGIRMGIIFKSLLYDIKRIMLPDRAVIVEKYHHIKDLALDDRIVRTTMLIVISYVFSYALGSVIGVFYNYGVIDSIFESVSAGSNSGLSCGVTLPSMPNILKVIYIFEMWAGRLEFTSIFALLGFIYICIKGKK